MGEKALGEELANDSLPSPPTMDESFLASMSAEERESACPEPGVLAGDNSAWGASRLRAPRPRVLSDRNARLTSSSTSAEALRTIALLLLPANTPESVILAARTAIPALARACELVSESDHARSKPTSSMVYIMFCLHRLRESRKRGSLTSFSD